ncbi:MAG: hypothetical protein JWR61_1647 [Ferruginibacter sp.]|uniref:hypothetical protein n=1 Tax=Ferruginibacter sp. TaxID=1940288 RepID=UPI002659FCB2|nr:hypothetical protein [Ferruginibacter sp.]MDB5276692.1 hypothetical protein [Ferruginibacter sp.]
MKKYLFILVFCPFMSFAQAVDLDRFNFTVQFHSLPAMRLDSTYHTYNVVVESSRMMQPFMKPAVAENSVILEGWRKLPAYGHITIKVKLEDLLPESVSVKERIENIKNNLGQITGTRTLYHEEVVYTFAAMAMISDYKGMHIMDQTLADRGYKQVFKSPEFAFRPMAEGYFVLNTMTTTGDLYRNCVNRAMHYLSDRITDNFGYSDVTVNDMMWIVGNKKHPEYEDHRKAFQQLTEVLFSMNANQSIEGAREQLKPVIDYFESVKQRYTSSKRRDRKIRYASYYNLAVLYYYLDDPQAMMKEATGLVLNDFDTRDGKNFEATATNLKNIFQQANIYTRHFKIDPLSYRGPLEGSEQTVR